MIVTSAVEVMELIHDLAVEGKLDLNFNITQSKNKTSISKMAKGAIMEYPVVASRSLAIEDLSMVNKALERQYTTYVRLAMSLNDEIGSKKTKADYINQFHSNMGASTTGLDVASKGLKTYGAVKGMKNESADIEPEFEVDYLTEELIFNEARGRGRTNSYINANKYAKQTKAALEKNMELKQSLSGQKDKVLDQQQTIRSQKEKINNLTQELDDRKKLQGRYNTDPSASPYKNQLLDNDIKKANELVPSTISVAVRREGYDGYDHIMIGVKTILHGVNSEEMIQNVSSSLREKRNLFRFIQWTTGEIKFVKDYLLAVDRLKGEAISSKKDSRWWRSLKTKSRLSKLRQWVGSKKQLIPNCSLVMSMDEIEYLNNIYDIDLLNNIHSVKQLMDLYFLLGFVIVDPASEMTYFFFDGNEDYQTFTFSALERENSNPQRDLKNMLSLMGR